MVTCVARDFHICSTSSYSSAWSGYNFILRSLQGETLHFCVHFHSASVQKSKDVPHASCDFSSDAHWTLKQTGTCSINGIDFL